MPIGDRIAIVNGVPQLVGIDIPSGNPVLLNDPSASLTPLPGGGFTSMPGSASGITPGSVPPAYVPIRSIPDIHNSAMFNLLQAYQMPSRPVAPSIFNGSAQGFGVNPLLMAPFPTIPNPNPYLATSTWTGGGKGPVAPINTGGSGKGGAPMRPTGQATTALQQALAQQPTSESSRSIQALGNAYPFLRTL